MRDPEYGTEALLHWRAECADCHCAFWGAWDSVGWLSRPVARVFVSGGCLDTVGFGIMCRCKMNVRARQNRMRSGRVAVWRRLTAARLVRSCNPTTSTPPLGSIPLVSMLELADLTLKLVNESNLNLNLPTSTSQIVYEPLPGDDSKKRKPDITLAKELLGWEPKIPLAEGLVKTIAYFRQF